MITTAHSGVTESPLERNKMTKAQEQDKVVPFIVAKDAKRITAVARGVSEGKHVCNLRYHGMPLVSLVTPKVGARARLELQAGEMIEKEKLVRALALAAKRVTTEPTKEADLDGILTYLLCLLTMSETEWPKVSF